MGRNDGRALYGPGDLHGAISRRFRSTVGRNGGCLMDQRRPGVQFTDAVDRQMIRGEKLEGEHHNRRDGR